MCFVFFHCEKPSLKDTNILQVEQSYPKLQISVLISGDRIIHQGKHFPSSCTQILTFGGRNDMKSLLPCQAKTPGKLAALWPITINNEQPFRIIQTYSKQLQLQPKKNTAKRQPHQPCQPPAAQPQHYRNVCTSSFPCGSDLAKNGGHSQRRNLQLISWVMARSLPGRGMLLQSRCRLHGKDDLGIIR